MKLVSTISIRTPQSITLLWRGCTIHERYVNKVTDLCYHTFKLLEYHRWEKSDMRLEILMAVKNLMLLFWTVIPCGLVGRHQHFGKTYRFHLQGVTIQKTNTDNLIPRTT
jgi:hypothetical protein